MKTSIFFFWMLVTVMVCGQTPDVHKYISYYPNSQQLKAKYEYYYDTWAEKKVKHGRYSEWAKHGEMQLDCYYQHNELEGTMQLFDKKGNLAKVKMWEKGKLVKVIAFYSDGKVKKEKHYDAETNEISACMGFSRKQICRYKISQTQGKYEFIRYDTAGKELKKRVFPKCLLPFW